MFYLLKIQSNFAFKLCIITQYEVAFKNATPIAANRMLRSKFTNTTNTLRRPLDGGPIDGQVSGVPL